MVDLASLLSTPSDLSPVRHSFIPVFELRSIDLKTRRLPPAATLGSVDSDQEAAETTGIDENRQPKTPNIVRVTTNMGLSKKQSFGVSEMKTPSKNKSPAARKRSARVRSIIVSASLKTKRKRKTHLSATQLAARESVAAFKDKVFRLELDILNLRQQVRDLEECRDLHLTRILLARNAFQRSAMITRMSPSASSPWTPSGSPCLGVTTSSRAHAHDSKGSALRASSERRVENGFMSGSYQLLSTRVLSFVERGDVDALASNEADGKARSAVWTAVLRSLLATCYSNLGLVALLTRQTALQ